MRKNGFANSLLIIMIVVFIGFIFNFLSFKKLIPSIPKSNSGPAIIPLSASASTSSSNLIPNQTPVAVLKKYMELEQRYNVSLGANIAYCTKNNEGAYVLSGNGGYTSIKFYYSKDGNELGSSSFVDIVRSGQPLSPEPSINIREYACTIIKESERFKKIPVK